MPGATGSVLPVSTSSAIISARFQRISNTSASIQLSNRILPFSCDRIAASVVALVGDPGDGVGHLRGSLGRAERRPRRECGLRRGDRIGHVLLRCGRRMPHDDARFARVCDRERLVGLTLRAPDVQPCPNCLQRFSHDDQAPLCVLSSVMGTALCVHKQVYVHSCLLVNHIVLLSPRRAPHVGIRPQASR